MFVKIGMDEEAKTYIKSFLNSPSYIDVPGLQDLQSDYVPEKPDLQAMIAWASAHSSDPLAAYLIKTIIPACFIAIKKSNGAQDNVKHISMQDSDNVHAIAGVMEAAMTSGVQQLPQQLVPQSEQDTGEHGQMTPVELPEEIASSNIFDNMVVGKIPGIDNYTKGIERLITAEVKRRVREAEKIHKLEIIEKDAKIARLNAELKKIKEAISGI